MRQIGFDDADYQFDELKFLQKIRPLQAAFWVGNQYTIETNTSKGINIRDRNYELQHTQFPIDGEFLFFVGLYQKEAYFISHALKSNFKLDIPSGTLIEIPYKSIIAGMQIGNLQFCAFKNEIWLYDFTKNVEVWKHSIEPTAPRKDFYSKNLYGQGQIVITNMSYEYLSFLKLDDGQELTRIYPSDFPELSHNSSIGPHFILNDLLICFGDIRKDKMKDFSPKNLGRRDLIAINLNTKKLAYSIRIPQWLNKIVSAKHCLHSIHYGESSEEIYYSEINLMTGTTNFSFSIQDQIDAILKKEDINEYKEMLRLTPRIDGIFYANNCIYFGFGSHYLQLSQNSRQLKIILKRADLIGHSTPIVIDDQLIMTDTIYKMQ
ncbi:MAG: hypothetical protein MRY78_03050 [Saprospiraceae bacterium]|nr:hypothetical protein [Saprospiraceae bacterium]